MTRLLALRRRLMAWPALARLGGVALALGLGTLLRIILLGPEPGEGYPSFIPLVLACGLLLGLGHGLLAVLGAWLIGTFFFTEPPLSMVIDDPFDLTAAMLFPALSVLLLLFVEVLVSPEPASPGEDESGT